MLVVSTDEFTTPLSGIDFYEIFAAPASTNHVEVFTAWLSSHDPTFSFEISFQLPDILEIMVYKEDNIAFIEEELLLLDNWFLSRNMTAVLLPKRYAM